MAYIDTISHHCLNGAKVQAFAPPLIDFPVAYRGGPVLERIEHQRYRHMRGGRPVDSARPDQAFEAALEGDYIYAGPMYYHFGHFMAEMVHRILPAKLLGLPGRFLFVTTQGDDSFGKDDAIPSFVRDVLSFFGLTQDDAVIVNRNTAVERLHLVAQESNLGVVPNTGYLDALRDYATDRLDQVFAGVARPGCLYVSRSSWAKAGSLLGESAFEADLEQAGYTIFHPEEHSLLLQMDHYRKAQSIVFPGGSACHGVELLGAGMLGSVMLVPRTASQIVMFERVLRPRAAAFACASEEAIYLGSLFRNRGDGGEAFHRGVSIYAVDRLLATFEAATLPPVRRPSLTRYFKAAALDLATYGLESLREAGMTPLARAPSLTARFARQAAWQIFERLRGTGRKIQPIASTPAVTAAEVPQPRVLSKQEIGEIWRASAVLGVPHQQFVRLAIVTLQLRPDLLAMRWSELSDDRSRWTIPAERSKNGVARSVPVSAVARAVLAELEQQNRFDLVLTSNGRPLSGLIRVKQKLDDELAERRAREASEIGREPKQTSAWALNDIRRSAMLTLAVLGIDRRIAYDMLGLDVPPDLKADRSFDVHYAAECALALDLWGNEVIVAARRIQTGVN